MHEVQEVLILLLGFSIVVVAATQIAKLFKKINLPVITGLLITGILAGPFILKLIPYKTKDTLYFINEIALAFIAFAASSELYLKELRSRFKSIRWMTFGQLVVTFVLSGIIIYVIEDSIPFMDGMNQGEMIAVALLGATIFVARSPASAIAIINEVRAKGPFTQTALGVTVLKDFLVIILFSINFSISIAIVQNAQFNFGSILILLAEMGISFLMALLLAQDLKLILKLRIHRYIKTAAILASGYAVYFLNHNVRDLSLKYFDKEFHIEPLLICIIGSFIITNYSKYRHEFIRLIQDASPLIYAVFFTLVGASISLDILMSVWAIALLLFGVRLATMIIGSFIGGSLAGDPPQFNRLGWMPYVTQAGVGLGLATLVAKQFPGWGEGFATLIIAVIVLSQIVGPPLFKWSINKVGESHERASSKEFDGVRDAIIFGLENQSVALARQLMEHNWIVKIATFQDNVNVEDYPDLNIQKINEINQDTMEELDVPACEAIVTMLTDEENYKICELAYENYGTKDLVVRLNNRYNMDKFHRLGCLIVDPSTAIVSLMDHLVRSPQAATLLLGLQEDQDTIDVEVSNPDLYGIPLRDLKIPPDIIILSVKRRGHLIISHGYTRLRKGDILTIVGSRESLENMELRLGK